MHPTNPYSAGGIVEDPAMYFGRHEELNRARDRMSKGDSTAIVGLRRIGKSSLLYQLAHQTDALPDHVVIVYLDLQDPVHHRPLDLLSSALHHLNERLNHRYNFPPVKSLSDFSMAVKQIAADGFQPVICLDEIEELTDRDAFDDVFFECLRSLGNQHVLAFVTASKESLDVLIKRNKLTSPFYNIFIDLNLAGLSDEAARTLLTEPFSKAGLPVPFNDHVNYVLELVGHHPFYLQIAAYHLFEAQRKGVVDHQSLRKKVVQDARQHFRTLWRHLSTDRQGGLKKLADAWDWEYIQKELEDCGLIEGPSADPRIFSDLFAQQIRKGSLEPDDDDDDEPLPEDTTTSDNKHRQRWLLGGLAIIVSLVALTLWLVFGKSSQAATLDCKSGAYVVSLDYSRYLAIGDRGYVNWNLHNETTQPITATLTIVLSPTHARIEGQNSSTMKNLKRASSGQMSFYRRLFWRRGDFLTPTVELGVEGVPVICTGTLNPIQSGAIPWLNSVWAWFSTAGPLSWLVLAGLEFFKAIGKRQAGD